MKQPRHFRRVNELRESTQATTLIADLSHIVDILNVEIACREQEAGVSDLARPEYPSSPER